VEAGVSPALSRDCSRHGCLYSPKTGITDAGYRGPLLFLGIHSSQKENFIPFVFLLFDLFEAAAAWKAELCDA
jgi:hypothetical protein